MFSSALRPVFVAGREHPEDIKKKQQGLATRTNEFKTSKHHRGDSLGLCLSLSKRINVNLTAIQPSDKREAQSDAA
jgi:hypothetical protein